MATLTDREAAALRGKTNRLEVAFIRRMPPMAMLVTDRMTPTAMVGACFPVPKMSRGWRLWKSSRMELADYLAAFERRSIEVEDPAAMSGVARAIMLEADHLRLPVLFDNANAAAAFGHEAEPGVWSFNRTFGMCRLSTLLRSLNEQAIVTALKISNYPPFKAVPAEEVQACGVRCEAHEPHPRKPFLRVLCREDSNDLRVALPWGAPLGRAVGCQPTEDFMTDTILRVEANVVRVVKSPLNPRVKVVELSCGHDFYINPPITAPRKGAPVACAKCKDDANRRHSAAKGPTP